MQPARPGRVGLQLAAQLGHVQPEVAGRVGVARAPHLGEQLPLAQQLARMAEQHLEQVPLGRGQPDVGCAVARPRMTRLAARSTTRSPSRTCGSSPSPVARPAHRGPHPGQQFVHAERLGHVVVRAGVQRLDLVGAVGPAGQHDDRRGASSRAAPRSPRTPSRSGRPRSRMTRSGGCRAAASSACGAGGRGVHVVVAHPQVDPQRAEDLRLVVDDQDAASPGPAVPRLRPPSRAPRVAAGRGGSAAAPAAGRAAVAAAGRRGQRQRHGQPAARGLLRFQGAAHRLGQARGTAPGRGRRRWCCRCRRAAGTARRSGPGRPRVCPGPRSTTRSSTRSPSALAVSSGGLPGGRVAQRVGGQVDDDPLQDRRDRPGPRAASPGSPR